MTKVDTFFKSLTDQELLTQVKNIVQNERQIQVRLLNYLEEIERRKLFLEMGHSSLFDFVTKELGYSESAGYRRIQAMRLLKNIPAVGKKISDGTLNLTTAAQLQTFIKSEEKAMTPLLPSETLELLSRVENKSSREVEKHLLSLKPSTHAPSEKVRQVSDTHTEIKLIIPEQLMKTSDHFRLLFSHINPEMSYQDLFAHLANKAIQKYDNAAQVKTNQSLPAPKVNNSSTIVASETELSEPTVSIRSRYIPSFVRASVWRRDGGRCTYIDRKTGKKCDSNFQIQVDHIKPFACGGSSKLENLRLLCGAHNRLRAEKIFGRHHSAML